MLFVLYRILSFVFYALAFPALGLLALAGSVKWRNRLGRGFGSIAHDGACLLWAHAASAGEARALALVVRAYCHAHPEARFVVSVVTDSGYSVACEALAELIDSQTVSVRFLPLDAPQPIRKALKPRRPDVFLFTETEIWPNWGEALSARAIPFALLNARLTERSLRKYQRAQSLIRHLTTNYRFVACQSAEHVERFEALGVPAVRIRVSGNVKLDAPAMALSDEHRKKLRGQLKTADSDFLLVCGSLRSGEFTGALEVYRKLKEQYSQFRLALAPRHLERCDDIIAEAQRLGITTRLYSDATVDNNTDAVTIIDVFGVLRELYGAGDLAFVGGTMAPIGGHNILEPLQMQTPALFGPYTENVTEAAALALERNCALQCADWEELQVAVTKMIEGEVTLKKWSQSNAQADSPLQKTVRMVEELVKGVV